MLELEAMRRSDPSDKKLMRQSRPGPMNAKWKGGRYIDGSGYIRVKAYKHPYRDNDAYVKEHRLVMEAHIGRYLLPNEVVHHINGNPQDNRIENLRLLSRTQHQHIHFMGLEKIDMSGRACLDCQSLKTWKRLWYKNEAGYLCNRCYMRRHDRAKRLNALVV